MAGSVGEEVMIRPLRDLLVIRPLKQPGMIGLIHIPDTERCRDKTGVWAEVVAAGPKVELAHVGTKVHVAAYGSHLAGDEVTVDGEVLTLIRERDINGVEAKS